MQHGDYIVGRHRTAEEVALQFGATGPLQDLKLLSGLHTLGGYGHAKAVAQIGHGVDDGHGIALIAKLAYEALVDLYPIERETS